MKHDLRAMKETCYVNGHAVKNRELLFEEAEENEADVFSVYEREQDGCLRWIADFGDRGEAEKWRQMAEMTEAAEDKV
jgi:hypothetical protein